MFCDVRLPLSSRASCLTGSFIDSSTELLANQSHDIVRFAMGAPSEDLIPTSDLDEALSLSSTTRFDYGESAGEPSLRAEITRLSEFMGVPTVDERIVVTTGAMQGLDLAFKMLVDPGDLVVMEAPTYTNAYSSAKSYEADVVSVPMDAEGMLVDRLEDVVRRQGRLPKVIYTIPTFQNPTGITLARERRVRLLELADKWGTTIVEDDPYGLLRFHGDKIPSFLELSPGNPLVFRVQTFSKILAPGLRVGWIDVDPELRNLAVNAKQGIDTCTNVPVQRAIADYLGAGKLEAHLDRIVPIYKNRNESLTRALENSFGESVSITRPDGGYFLWAQFQGEMASVDTQKLFPLALEQGVAFVPGQAFSPGGEFPHGMRLCFATSSPRRIYAGVERLKRAVDTYVS